jgi:hypothetical protein
LKTSFFNRLPSIRRISSYTATNRIIENTNKNPTPLDAICFLRFKLVLEVFFTEVGIGKISSESPLTLRNVSIPFDTTLILLPDINEKFKRNRNITE